MEDKDLISQCLFDSPGYTRSVKNLQACYWEMNNDSYRLKSLVATVRGGQITEALVVQVESVTGAQENNPQSQSQPEEDN